jgi:hypothetical protein
MSFSGWLIAGAIFIIILTIALGIGWWIRNNSNPTPSPPNKYSTPFVWGTPVPGPNSQKNFCQLYQFPTSFITLDNVPTAVPGAPTFNPLILDKLQGVPRYPTCLDPDQIMAQQLEHTCTAPNGVVDGSITRCFLINGGVTGLGGTEVYYTNSGCFNVSACPGQLSLISVNFQAPTVSDIYCIQNEGTGTNVTMQLCNPSINSQLFRLTRINPGQNPNTLQPGEGQNGLIAQILDRDSGLCLIAGTGTSSTIYDPNYLQNTECTGNQITINGTNVIMSTCTGGQFPGYVWLLLPSTTFCGVSGGCSGCIGYPNGSCQRIPKSNNCEGFLCGLDACTGNAPMINPPQIVYIGNINLNDAPVGPTGYKGLTGSNAIIQWLIDNNAQSLYYGGAGNGLILAPMGTDISVCTEKPFTSQYMNLTTYNTISQESVCLQQGTLGTINCTGL